MNTPNILPVIAVVGPFRSGTSCVAGTLHNLGISMGLKFIKSAKFNLKGTFEAQWLQKICKECYEEPNMIEREPKSSRVAKLREWAIGRTKQLAIGSLIGAKHPTLCLMVEDMVEAWPQVRIISVDRPIEESVESGLRTGWLPTAEQIIPKMVEIRDTVIAATKVPTLRVSYHNLLDNPRSVIYQMINFCGISPNKREVDFAVHFVDPALCHHDETKSGGRNVAS